MVRNMIKDVKLRNKAGGGGGGVLSEGNTDELYRAAAKG